MTHPEHSSSVPFVETLPSETIVELEEFPRFVTTPEVLHDYMRVGMDDFLVPVEDLTTDNPAESVLFLPLKFGGLPVLPEATEGRLEGDFFRYDISKITRMARGTVNPNKSVLFENYQRVANAPNVWTSRRLIFVPDLKKYE